MSSVRILIEIASVVPFCIFKLIFVFINNSFLSIDIFAVNGKIDYFIVIRQLMHFYTIWHDIFISLRLFFNALLQLFLFFFKFDSKLNGYGIKEPHVNLYIDYILSFAALRFNMSSLSEYQGIAVTSGTLHLGP